VKIFSAPIEYGLKTREYYQNNSESINEAIFKTNELLLILMRDVKSPGK